MTTYPAVEELSFTSRALVQTDRPERYAKQLVSHMGRKVPAVEIEGGHRITFDRDDVFNGYGDVLVIEEGGEHRLALLAYAPSAEKLERVEGVLARHLERFGERDGLKVIFA